MATILLDLVPRFEAAFGPIPLLADSSLLLVPGGQYANFFNGAEIYVNTPADFEDLAFTIGDEDYQFGYRPVGKSGDMGALLAPPPIIGTHGSKNLVETMINNTDSVVVERYGDNPWDFKMSGIIVDMQGHQFPKERMARLVRLFKHSSEIAVASEWFDAQDIQSIYFTEVDLTGVQGFTDTVSYTMTGKSIRPIEFYLNGEEEL